MWCRVWNACLTSRSPRRVSTEKGRSYGWCRLITPFFVFCFTHDNAGRASCSTGAKISKSLFAIFLIVVSPSGIIGFVIASWFAGVYGGPVTGRHLLLRSGARGAHLLLAIVAWVVDRLLSKSVVMLISFSCCSFVFGSFALSASVWPLLILVLPLYRFSVNAKTVLFFILFPL